LRDGARGRARWRLARGASCGAIGPSFDRDARANLEITMGLESTRSSPSTQTHREANPEVAEPGRLRSAIEKHDRTKLAKGYFGWHRTAEYFGIAGTIVTTTWLLVRLIKSPATSLWLSPHAFFLGLLTADFISGFIHWTCDTWGKVDFPVLGPLVLRSFREHHVDKKMITRHDFIETNGQNLTLAGVAAAVGLAVLDDASLGATFVAESLLATAFLVGMTSQIHKWAHADSVPPFVRLLQRARLILPPEHHEGHHSAPYNKNYCITAGLLDIPLGAMRFWSTAERIITATTGMVPREDDVGRAAAIEVMEVMESEDSAAAEAAYPLPQAVPVKTESRDL
jgi:ubiquitin-conjugating enzyme E2 variant